MAQYWRVHQPTRIIKTLMQPEHESFDPTRDEILVYSENHINIAGGPYRIPDVVTLTLQNGYYTASPDPFTLEAATQEQIFDAYKQPLSPEVIQQRQYINDFSDSLLTLNALYATFSATIQQGVDTPPANFSQFSAWYQINYLPEQKAFLDQMSVVLSLLRDHVNQWKELYKEVSLFNV